MKLLDRFHTLRSKFLVVLLIPVVIATVAITGLFGIQTFIDLRDDVLAKKESMAEHNVELLKAPMWNFDQSHVAQIAASIAADADVASIIVRNDQGEVIVQLGEPELELVVWRNIAQTGLKQTYVLGELEITFRMERIYDAITRQTVQNSLLLLLLVLVILISAVFANRWIVGQPLDRLLRAIRLSEEGGLRGPVEWQSKDEIGEVIAAYNAMQEKLGTEEQKLRISEANLEDAQSLAHLGSWNLDLTANQLTWSGEIFRIFEIDKEAFGATYEAFLDSIHPDDREMVNRTYHDSVENNKPYDIDHRLLMKDGRIKYVNERGHTFYEDGRAIRSVGTVQDITERKQAEDTLRLAASVFTHASEGITITDTDGTIIDVNDAFTQITGYSRDEALGQNPRILKSGRQEPEFYATMWRDLVENGHWSGEIWNRHKNGEVYAEMLTISAVRDAQGKTQHYVALFFDITEQKAHQKQLEHIAHYDALTSLPNRVLLADRLHQAMAHAERRRQQLAVAYLDLDGFKEINDSHGHKVGDQLLITLATRMKKALREVDTIARLGGDEFVAVLNILADTKDSVPMLSRLLAAAAQPVHIGDLVLQVSASIGVTFYPQAEPVDADQLLRQADQAMYQAKVAGKNRYHVFDAEQDRNVRGYHESLEHIRRALNEHEFVLHYQPKVNMRTGELVGAEALIRWQHPEQGLLLPIVFLPVIEDHPLAIELGEWVIDTALAQLEAWHTAGLDFSVSVNVSALQMQQDNFTERLCKLLAAHPDVKPSLLELEVLETSALEDMERMSQVMHRCGELGVRFALDDFGTGYSSLTYLKRLPAAQLKIDRSFVLNMLNDPEDLAIVEGVLGLAGAFRRQPIAEGVETVEHGELLLQLGCELAQGYGIARPMPADELQGWIGTWQPKPSWANQRQVSRDDLPLLFASVEHRAWIRAIEDCLKGERIAPPPLDHHQCRFGQWLDSEGRTRHGSHPAFQAIEPLHRQVHTLAMELLELQNQARGPEAQPRLGELYSLRDALLGHLKVLLQVKPR